ncbi:MAG: DUF4834 family protein [Prevotella sp.]|nr:DUF4834 family protein [Prevotella sp.]
MILLQFFALICFVVAMIVIGLVVNLIVNFLFLKHKLSQGARRKFGARGNAGSKVNTASNGAKNQAQSAAKRKKIIPDDEGEYVDFVEL